MTIGATERVREFPRITLPDQDHLQFPRSELVMSLMSFVVHLSHPGIIGEQESLRDAITLLDARGVEDHVPLGIFDKRLATITGKALIDLADVRGLLTPDTLTQSPNLVPKIYPRERFPDLVKAVESCPPTEVNGIFHGAVDFPHVEHAIVPRAMYPYTHRTVVLVDPNWLVKQQKNREDDPRPRIESMIWKMMQLAALPTIMAVAEAPIEKGDNVDHFWAWVYKTLHITCLGTEDSNPLLNTYRGHMRQRGGEVIATRSRPGWTQVLYPTSATMKRRYWAKGDWGGHPAGLARSKSQRQIESEAEQYEAEVRAYWQSR